MNFNVGDLVRLTEEGVRRLKEFNPSVNTKYIYKVVIAEFVYQVVDVNLYAPYLGINVENIRTTCPYLYVDFKFCIKVHTEVKLNRKLLL